MAHDDIDLALRAGHEDVEILSIDEGPGIENIAASMRDGFSTGSDSPGTGLGALRRLADDFDLYSKVPLGTVCVARVRKAGARSELPAADGFELGAVCLPLAGETVCGDAWGFDGEGASASEVDSRDR